MDAPLSVSKRSFSFEGLPSLKKQKLFFHTIFQFSSQESPQKT
jgi:hypothetical protein